MSKFVNDDNQVAKAIAIPPVFSENSRAKNSDGKTFENIVRK